MNRAYTSGDGLTGLGIQFMEGYMQDIYTDAFTNISVTGGIVRIDLGSLQAPAKGETEPTVVNNQRLIMPLDAFLVAHRTCEQVIGKMQEAGLIRKREDAANNALPGTSTPPEKK